jgi:hypothetical protein
VETNEKRRKTMRRRRRRSSAWEEREREVEQSAKGNRSFLYNPPLAAACRVLPSVQLILSVSNIVASTIVSVRDIDCGSM